MGPYPDTPSRGVDAPLGVVLAGGESRRYGRPKAFAEVAGRTLVERALDALDGAGLERVIVANDVARYESLGYEVRPDTRAGLGVLGGILTAVGWARERARAGAVVLACDMPFVPASLLRRLVDEALAPPRPAVVAPESDGPRGVEPLCAFYGVDCVAAIERSLAAERRHVIGFWRDVPVRRVPLAAVRSHGDPARMFMNVNTPAERAAAERAAEEASL